MKKLEENMAEQALGPDAYAEYKKVSGRLAANSRNLPELVRAGVPIDEWWNELADGVAPQLAKAEVAAERDRNEKYAAEMPWVHEATPAEMLRDIERMQWFNNRIRRFIREMDGKHAALAECLTLQATMVRSILQQQETELGKVITKFALRLKKAGLKAESVKDLSNGAVEAFADALGGKGEANLFALLGVGRPQMTEAEIANMEAEQAQINAEFAAFEAERAEQLKPLEKLDGPIAAPRVRPLEEWDYDEGPFPPDWWSFAQGTPADYEWEYRYATDEEFQKAINTDFPEAHSWGKLREWDRNFAEIALDRIRTQKGAAGNVRYLVSVRKGIDPDAVDENLVRAWLFLLAARTMPQEDFERLFEPGYFDRIMIPCYASGVGVIRELHWLGNRAESGHHIAGK